MVIGLCRRLLILVCVGVRTSSDIIRFLSHSGDSLVNTHLLLLLQHQTLVGNRGRSNTLPQRGRVVTKIKKLDSQTAADIRHCSAEMDRQRTCAENSCTTTGKRNGNDCYELGVLEGKIVLDPI